MGLGSLADNCPRKILEIVRCSGNTRTIWEFCGQRFFPNFWRTILEIGGKLSGDNRCSRTIVRETPKNQNYYIIGLIFSKYRNVFLGTKTNLI